MWTALSAEVAVMFGYLDGGGQTGYWLHPWDSACESAYWRAVEVAREWRKHNRERQRIAVARTEARRKVRASIDPAYARILRAKRRKETRKHRAANRDRYRQNNRRASAARAARDKLAAGKQPTPYQAAMLAEVEANKIRTQTRKRVVSIEYQRNRSGRLL